MVDVEERGQPRPSVLVVDDEPAVCVFLQRILTRLGYEVETAGSGMEALERVGQRSFDVVLTDIVMPRVDGIEVIRRVKELTPETEVVVITGYPSAETIIEATRAGALDYLPKSPDPGHLAALIEKAMGIRDLRRKANERDYYVRMAQMDGVTDLFNQEAFEGFLAREVSRSARTERPLCLLVADVDRLTQLNERFGRPSGDRVLRHVAGLLRGTCRSYDIVARRQDDLFAILAPETRKEGGETLARRAVETVAKNRCEHLPDAGQVSISVGVAAFPADAREIPELFARADEALFSAKRAGGGIACLA